MSGECQVNVKSQSELDIGGRETCWPFYSPLSLHSVHFNFIDNFPLYIFVVYCCFRGCVELVNILSAT